LEAHTGYGSALYVATGVRRHHSKRASQDHPSKSGTAAAQDGLMVKTAEYKTILQEEPGYEESRRYRLIHQAGF
jgi:hypothetical protein